MTAEKSTFRGPHSSIEKKLWWLMWYMPPSEKLVSRIGWVPPAMTILVGKTSPVL
jgi:hypothetical protein